MYSELLFIQNLGVTEIVAIVLLFILFFGGKKIPELARGIGKGIREFNSARASIEEDIKNGIKEEEKKELSSKPESVGQSEKILSSKSKSK